MIVSDILKSKPNTDVVTIDRAATIEEAVKLLARWRIGALVVVEQGDQLCGIISERDIVRSLAGAGARTLALTVADLMTSEVVVCRPDEPLTALERSMTVNRIRHLPVVEAGQLAGIITIGDVVKAGLDEARHEVDQMREYVLLNH